MSWLIDLVKAAETNSFLERSISLKMGEFCVEKDLKANSIGDKKVSFSCDFVLPKITFSKTSECASNRDCL